MIEKFLNKIIQGNSLEVLKELPDESLHCVICSPPYWSLRVAVYVVGLTITERPYAVPQRRNFTGGKKHSNHRNHPPERLSLLFLSTITFRLLCHVSATGPLASFSITTKQPPMFHPESPAESILESCFCQ